MEKVVGAFHMKQSKGKKSVTLRNIWTAKRRFILLMNFLILPRYILAAGLLLKVVWLPNNASSVVQSKRNTMKYTI